MLFVFTCSSYGRSLGGQTSSGTSKLIDGATKKVIIDDLKNGAIIDNIL